MVKVKMFIAEYLSELELEINQFLNGLHPSDVVDIQFRRDPRAVSQYTACITYKVSVLDT